jgi:hypothetical protein
LSRQNYFGRIFNAFLRRDGPESEYDIVIYYGDGRACHSLQIQPWSMLAVCDSPAVAALMLAECSPGNDTIYMVTMPESRYARDRNAFEDVMKKTYQRLNAP